MTSWRFIIRSTAVASSESIGTSLGTDLSTAPRP